MVLGRIQGTSREHSSNAGCVCSFDAERAYTSSGRHSPEQTVGVAVAAAREAASACTCGGHLWAPRDRGRQPSGSPRAEAACLVDMASWQGGAVPQHPGLCAHALHHRERSPVRAGRAAGRFVGSVKHQTWPKKEPHAKKSMGKITDECRPSRPHSSLRPTRSA